MKHLNAWLQISCLVREELDHSLVASRSADVVEALVDLRHFARNLVLASSATLLDMELQEPHDWLHVLSQERIECLWLLLVLHEQVVHSVLDVPSIRILVNHDCEVLGPSLVGLCHKDVLKFDAISFCGKQNQLVNVVQDDMFFLNE